MYNPIKLNSQNLFIKISDANIYDVHIIINFL